MWNKLCIIVGPLTRRLGQQQQEARDSQRARGRRGAQGGWSVWAPTLGQRGLAPDFHKGPWWSVGMFPLNRIKFPQALFEATK